MLVRFRAKLPGAGCCIARFEPSWRAHKCLQRDEEAFLSLQQELLAVKKADGEKDEKLKECAVP